ncbi:hypothetical protein GCM10023193_60330 [Planotetraspora kaengkrachanensis]|uniref:Uncharacterized protein n=1 Tax=Planotetraspora kaengkrachanensis TaxID=575193 RepID=A0A8J3PX23_9ACTN|nr:hypothetical protein Pka01_56000 [Planotetraspora kaengkrachanensis]
MRPQFAHLNTEGVADLSRRRRSYFAPHQARTLPLWEIVKQGLGAKDDGDDPPLSGAKIN